jgi:hypothetical protein
VCERLERAERLVELMARLEKSTVISSARSAPPIACAASRMIP